MIFLKILLLCSCDSGQGWWMDVNYWCKSQQNWAKIDVNVSSSKLLILFLRRIKFKSLQPATSAQTG